MDRPPFESIDNLFEWVNQVKDEREQSQRKMDRLRQSLRSALDLIGDVRYQEWPALYRKDGDTLIQVHGLGIGLDPAAMDEVLIEGERAIDYSRRRNRRKK